MQPEARLQRIAKGTGNLVVPETVQNFSMRGREGNPAHFGFHGHGFGFGLQHRFFRRGGCLGLGARISIPDFLAGKDRQRVSAFENHHSAAQQKQEDTNGDGDEEGGGGEEGREGHEFLFVAFFIGGRGGLGFCNRRHVFSVSPRGQGI